MPGAIPIWRHDDARIYDLAVTGNDGRVIGSYAGQPIFESVFDLDGYRYVYVGVAPRLRNGRVDVRALRENQWLVEPGLVYEWDRHSRRKAGRAGS
jgi:hypothetical protein